MLHLDQQVQSFLKLIRRRTKAPPKNIYALTSVDLTDATLHETLQYCKESPKAPFLSRMSAWLLHLARASTLYLDQQIQPFLKWLKGQTKVFTNGIDTLTGSDLWDATLQYYQELLKARILSPTSVWHLQLTKTSMLHLNEQIQPFIQYLQWRTKAPTNRIKALIRVYIVVITLQAFQEILNAPFLYPMSAWHLKLRRAFMLHLYQQVQPFLKWLWGRTKAPANNINALTSFDLTDATLQA